MPNLSAVGLSAILLSLLLVHVKAGAFYLDISSVIANQPPPASKKWVPVVITLSDIADTDNIDVSVAVS